MQKVYTCCISVSLTDRRSWKEDILKGRLVECGQIMNITLHGIVEKVHF